MDPVSRRLDAPLIIEGDQSTAETIQNAENREVLIESQDSIEQYASTPTSLSQAMGSDVYTDMSVAPELAKTVAETPLKELQNRLDELVQQKLKLRMQLKDLAIEIAFLQRRIAESEQPGYEFPLIPVPIGGSHASPEDVRKLAELQKLMQQLQLQSAKIDEAINVVLQQIEELKNQKPDPMVNVQDVKGFILE